MGPLECRITKVSGDRWRADCHLQTARGPVDLSVVVPEAPFRHLVRLSMARRGEDVSRTDVRQRVAGIAGSLARGRARSLLGAAKARYHRVGQVDEGSMHQAIHGQPVGGFRRVVDPSLGPAFGVEGEGWDMLRQEFGVHRPPRQLPTMLRRAWGAGQAGMYAHRLARQSRG